jgi:hemerythrin superfamily protein
MDIYDVLHDDHLYVTDLLERILRARRESRRDLVNDLVDAITAHSQAEEQVFYAKLADVDDFEQIVLEAKEEHLSVTRILEDLVAMRADDERFEAKIKVLRDLFIHHMEIEEEEIFQAAREVFDDDVAENIAGEFLALSRGSTRTSFAMRLPGRSGGSRLGRRGARWAASACT